MNRLLLACGILFLGGVVVWSQHHRRNVVEKQNAQLAGMAEVLKKRSEERASARAVAEQQLGPLQLALAAKQSAGNQAPADVAPPLAPAPPDVTRQGGWPEGADYFYLPKAFLQQASFQVLEQQQISAETASLFNLTEPEREEANRAIGDLFAQLRSAESERMQLVDLPVEWISSEFASGVAYHIPGFSGDVEAWREGFQQRLGAILGPERSKMLGAQFENHLREEWNDLGENERTVGFVWHPEKNGTQSLWSAIQDGRHGAGTFTRYVSGGPGDPIFRHYADLFGVELPER